jgi:hypothetical protein
MATITKTVAFTIDIDEEAIAPASANVFIYQMLNRLNYEHDLKSVTVDGITVDIAHPDQVAELPLGEDRPLK